MKARTVVRRTCAVVAVLAAAGALLMYLTGGYEFSVAGLVIRGRGPDRLAILAVVAVLLSVLVGRRTWMPDDDDLARLPRPALLAVLLALATFITALHFGSHAAGGSDSYGYLSQAHLWLSGSLRQPQPWASAAPWPSAPEAFVPLAYTLTPDRLALAPVYPPGLPLLMALAMSLAGACGAFVVVPASGAIVIGAVYSLGRFLSSAWVGLAAAWLVATNPVFLHMMVQSMSDMPATAAWALSFLLAAHARVRSAAGSGVAAACAVLIRLNLAPLVIVPTLWFLWLDWRDGTHGPRRPYRLLAFLAGLAPGAIGAAIINASLFGSPLLSGFGPASNYFDTTHFWPNVARYATWFTAVGTPLVWLGVAAVLAPLRQVWPHDDARRFVCCLAAFTVLLWLEYALYIVFDDWSYLRFLLPAFPIVMLGLAQAVRAAVVDRSPGLRALAAIVVVAIGVSGVIEARDRGSFRLFAQDARYQHAGRVVREATEPASVLFSMQHSGSLRYYAGRMTVRYDLLDPASLEQALSWFASQGAHPYALLDGWEVDVWRRRFGGSSPAARLDFQPIRRLESDDDMMLYDLVRPGPSEPLVVPAIESDEACAPPAPSSLPPAFR